ncbi:MAG: YbaB/EbfC family nucleoid-associated protein [Clostridia bacterium]|nr:YbaB/EbfC family nucleoid-associated protein [Clostridia bacterium]
MKARLPKGYNQGGIGNFQQLAAKAQKMQEDMQKVTEELEAKEYSMSTGGNLVVATVTGKMEIKSLHIAPEVVDKDDIEMLTDLITAAVNGALHLASEDKDKAMGDISSGLRIPGVF